MENKVRKVNHQTRKKYERRARRRNRRHPIEHIIELIILGIILVVIVSVTMHSFSKQNNLDKEESTQEDIANAITEQDSKEFETSSDITEETVEETEDETQQFKIPTTDSVWDDPSETVDSWISNFEKEYMEQVLNEWSAARHFFNITLGSLDMVLSASGVTQFTETMNEVQQRYIMSNVVLEPDNIIAEGTFSDKYTAYQALMTTMKDNLQSGICVSKRYIANDYIGYEAPLQNALGLVPANYEELADNLKHLHINLNIIPEEIEPREDWVEYVEKLHEYGIAAGIHFPCDSMEYATFQELKDVYQAIFDAGIDYIVMSEKVFPFVTGNEPATFSKRFIQMVRSEFGFEGVIITADMSSSEVQQYIVEQQIESPTVYAFLQGCDMIYVTENFGGMYGTLTQLYGEGIITDTKLKISMERILNKVYLYSCGE